MRKQWYQAVHEREALKAELIMTRSRSLAMVVVVIGVVMMMMMVVVVVMYILLWMLSTRVEVVVAAVVARCRMPVGGGGFDTR